MKGDIGGESVLLDRLPFAATPKVLPVESARALEHLQITHNSDDQLVTDVLLPSAAQQAEERLQRSLIRQQRRFFPGVEFLSSLSGRNLSIPYGPVTTITSVSYLDSDGATQAMPADNWRASGSDSIYFYGTIPTLAEGPSTVWVDYEAGYGDTFAAVPSAMQQVVLVLLYRAYERPEGASGKNNADDAWERAIDRLVVVAGADRRGS